MPAWKSVSKAVAGVYQELLGSEGDDTRDDLTINTP
jgi:hypothetical protein